MKNDTRSAATRLKVCLSHHSVNIKRKPMRSNVYLSGKMFLGESERALFGLVAEFEFDAQREYVCVLLNVAAVRLDRVLINFNQLIYFST